MSKDVEVEAYQGSDLRRETGWWGAFVVGLAGTIIVTIPSDVSQLIVKKSITVARNAGAPVLGLVVVLRG